MSVEHKTVAAGLSAEIITPVYAESDRSNLSTDTAFSFDNVARWEYGGRIHVGETHYRRRSGSDIRSNDAALIH